MKDVKKKKQTKKLVLPFCLPSPSARPMAPPDCLRVGCAPSKWFPSTSAEPQGAWDSGLWDLGRDGGGGEGFMASLCGAWAVGVERRAGAVGVRGYGRGGQNEPKEADPGAAGGGSGSACSPGLGEGRPRNLKSSQILWRVGQRLGGTYSRMAGRSQRGAGTSCCISRGGHKGEGRAHRKDDEGGR